MVNIRHHEFWNSHVFHLPIYLYWLYLACRARSLFFFSAANPGIETGGLLGESKFKILQKIHSRYVPKTLFFNTAPAVQDVSEALRKSKIGFPLVAKPDIGQGGWLVEVICDCTQLEAYLRRIHMPFMLQEFVTDPLELGLLYYRMPGQPTGKISSLVVKEFLAVTGDGKQTLRQLLSSEPRSKGYLKKAGGCLPDLMRIPDAGERVQVSHIGNHAYGTRFVNWNHLIDEKLTAVFDRLCSSIDGFYFGRFDLKCESIEAVRDGQFKVLELNGVGSEPLHIFDPATPVADAYKSAFFHWRKIYEISMINRQRVVPFMKLKDAWNTYREFVRIQRVHQATITIGN